MKLIKKRAKGNFIEVNLNELYNKFIKFNLNDYKIFF